MFENLNVSTVGSPSGGEKRSDHIRAMTLLPGVPDIVCDRKWSSDGARYCTAAVRVEKHLMAVWSVGDWGGETAEVKAAREGRVLVAFLRFGLREDARYPDLKAIACATLRPDSVAGPVHHENCYPSEIAPKSPRTRGLDVSR
jgi:hypothetical protein